MVKPGTHLFNVFIKDIIDQKVIKKERTKARELRKSQWWKQRISNGLCAVCEQRFPPSELTMDHRVPISRGGLTTKGNVQPLCKPCNNKKKDYTPEEIIMDGLF